MNRQVAIIHFNTPELTEAAIMSLRKHGGRDYQVTVFDNSNLRPFAKQMRGVNIIDNTKGQIIDFDKELEKYPQRCADIGVAKNCNFGSVKHMMTVQKLWELLPDGFVLIESDILLKQSIESFFRPEYSFVGYAQRVQPYNKFCIGRILPMLCYFNVPKFRAEGVSYYDPNRTYGLLPGGKKNKNNWYDTGASLLEDILTHRPRLKGLHIDIRKFMEHYGSGSWRNNSLQAHEDWLRKYRNLWELKMPNVAIGAMGRMENLYAREWVEHYRQMGICKIYIYDNNREGEERFEEVLQDYIREGFVQIIPWEGVQKDAYEDCYNHFGKNHDWMGFLDFDEFLQFDDKDMTVPDFLCAVIGQVVVINWREMTDNEKLYYEPKPLVERFTEAKPIEFPINGHTKCFVRTGIYPISFNDPHCPNSPKMTIVNVLGEHVPQIPIQKNIIHDIARIDHYDTKSAWEWANVKCKRGTCCGDEYTKRWLQKSTEYFFCINTRTPEKEAILKGEEPAKSKPKRLYRRKRKE